MTWKLTDAHYPQIDIHSDHAAGIGTWLEKITELAPQYEAAWNVLIADLWPNEGMSRLIGHVQMNDVAVGYDTGYRVCAYLENGGIVGHRVHNGDDIPLIQKWLSEAVKHPKTKTALSALSQTNPFEIRLTLCGYSPIDEGIKIAF